MKRELRIGEPSDDDMDGEFGVTGAEFPAVGPMRDAGCHL